MTLPSSKASTTMPPLDDAITVLVVDDSAVIRGLISKSLEGKHGIKVVGTASNGEVAIAALARHPADVVILDIEMPVMDGLTAIPRLKAIDPAVQIIMASTLTKKNADISLKAMSLGATDYVPKPSGNTELARADDFHRELGEKVLALGALARRQGVRRSAADLRLPPKPYTPPPIEKKNIVLRPDPIPRPEILAIGSSTGGPQALFTVIKAMGLNLPQPIVITQHMPPAFTSILAEHISRQCNVVCTEGKDGEVLKPSQYYVAPGDFHMLIVKGPNGPAIKLVKDPPENFCRPAVDPMLRSIISVYGKRIVVAILTGMGQDGCKGCQEVVKVGGGVLAQDEASSVVWGMPGAVAMAGVCSSVLPVAEIGNAVRNLATKAAP
ncbi:MAG: chemotaxis response regulator protein-glutamate methylesterase [Bdellovibrionales bacterium]